MQPIFLNVFLLAAGLILLIKGADYLAGGIFGLSRKLHIPAAFAGLLSASLAASLPAAAVAVSAALEGSPEISAGAAAGYVVFSILLVTGVTVCIEPVTLRAAAVRFELPLLAVCALFVAGAGAFTGGIYSFTGTVLIVILAAFFLCLLIPGKRGNAAAVGEISGRMAQSAGRSLFCTVIGIAAILLGGDVAAGGAEAVGGYIGFSPRVTGLTILAVAAGLPQLIICTKAALKGHADFAAGNIIGSSIVGFLLSFGAAGLLTGLESGRSLAVDGIICAAAALLLLLLGARNRKLSARHGILLIVICCACAACLVMGQVR